MGRLGYLFERFPSFTQTFCAREVGALRRAGFDGPIFSIRTPRDEPCEQGWEGLGEIIYLPESFDEVLAGDTLFRRAARKAQAELRGLWGDESEKRRIYEALWLARACEERNVGHLHVHFSGLAARAAFWLRCLGGPDYSVTAHANDIFRDEPPERLAQVLGAAAFVATVSDFSKSQIEGRFPSIKGRVHRVYNGVDLTGMDSVPRWDRRAGILSVGRAIQKKGFPFLIAACSMIRDLEFDCRIVGGGPLEDDLRRIALDAGMAARIHFDGPQPERRIHELMDAAHVFALPCVETSDGAMDNLPTVIMEAMAHGLPVVSTRLAGIPEMVEDGVTGLLVEPGNTQELAEALRTLLTNPALAERMGQAGRRRCADLFELSRTSSQLAGLFRGHGSWP